MAIPIQEARRIVEVQLCREEEQLNASQVGGPSRKKLHLIIAREEAREDGWLFFYDTREHLIEGDVIHALAGNWPYFVSREDGAVGRIGESVRQELMTRWKKEKKEPNQALEPTASGRGSS